VARKYKFHKTYAVIWYDRSVEIVKRLWAFNYYDGRIPLEAL
jgi:hypothetical protein